MQARETGICPIREELYNECFDELIRQVTINCLERGILLMRIKKEIEMTINSYQTLYESAIAYGIRASLLAEENKGRIVETCKSIEEECDFLDKRIEDLEKEIERKTRNDAIDREENNKKHEEFVNEYRRRNTVLKEDIKSKMSSFLK
jgi:dynein light intermediate chain